MVGVARSKACTACRARRKKCDEREPKCGLCTKRGIECVYKKDLNIVFFRPGPSYSTTSSSTRSTASSSTGTSPSPWSSATPDDLPLSCLVTSYQMQTQGYFLETYLPHPFRQYSGLPFDLKHAVCTDWLYVAQDLAHTDALLNDALSAWSLAYAETLSRPTETLHRSRMMYGKAMRMLSYRLQSGDQAYQDVTLAAVLVLTAYETTAATKAGTGGWLSHVKGASSLIKVRGKQNVSTEFGQQLFLATRLTELINGIGGRKAVDAVEQPSYSGFLQGRYASFAKFFEIAQTLPAILEQTDQVNASITSLSEAELKSKVSIMAYTCQDFESRLASWLVQLTSDQEAEGRKIFWEEPSSLYNALPLDSPARVYSTFLCFPSIDIAQMLVINWCCLLLSNLILQGVENSLRLDGSAFTSVFATDADRTANGKKMYGLATNITQSLEYFIRPEMGLIATDFLGLPINAVLGFWNGLASSAAASSGLSKTQQPLPQLLWFETIFERLRAMSPGFASLVEAMARKGGGGEAFKQLVLKEDQNAPQA